MIEPEQTLVTLIESVKQKTPAQWKNKHPSLQSVDDAIIKEIQYDAALSAARVYKSRSYNGGRRPKIELTPEEERRFWSKVDKNGPIPPHMPHLGQCWIWTGNKEGGYGRFSWRGTRVLAHRVAFEIQNRALKSGECGLHECDNPSCVRHIFAGTMRENTLDRDRKGRQSSGNSHYSRTRPWVLARGDRNGSRTHPEKRPRGSNHWRTTKPDRVPRGERVNTAKLTNEKVSEILRRYAAGETNQSQIAREYGVSSVAVQRIISGRSWKHIVRPK